MMESIVSFAQKHLTGIAKAGFLVLFAATTITMVMAENIAEFPGKGSRADWDISGTHYNRAIVLVSQGKDLEALEEYKSAISIYPYQAGYYYNYANQLKKLNQQDAAMEAYKKALQLNPNFVEAYCNMADLLTKQGKYVEADAACRRALQLDSNHIAGMINLAEALMGERKKEEAIKWLMSAKSSPEGTKYAKGIEDDLAKANAMVGR